MWVVGVVDVAKRRRRRRRRRRGLGGGGGIDSARCITGRTLVRNKRIRRRRRGVLVVLVANCMLHLYQISYYSFVPFKVSNYRYCTVTK